MSEHLGQNLNKTKPADHAPEAALLKTALAAVQTGQMKNALQLCAALLAANPKNVDALQLMATVEFSLGRVLEAERLLLRAVEFEPENAAPRLNLVFMLRQIERIAEAEKAIRQGIEIDSKNPAYWGQLAQILYSQMRYPEMAECCERWSELDLIQPDPHRFLGVALHKIADKLQRDDGDNTAIRNTVIARAEGAFREAIRRQPEDHMSLNNLAYLIYEGGRFDDAIKCYLAALEHKPDFDEARSNLYQLLLATGRFSEGWFHFRWRGITKKGTPTEYGLLPGILASEPQRLQGKSIAIISEQGLGDILFFLRYALALKNLGARLILWGNPEFETLLRPAKIFEAFASHYQSINPAALRVHLGDLPGIFFEAGYQELPRALHLPVKEDGLTAAKARLAAFGPPPYLGVTWRAGVLATGHKRTNFKSIDPHIMGTALRDYPGTIVSLQRRPEPGEIEAFRSGSMRKVDDMSLLNQSLPDMLSVLWLLDDYVGVSNTNMHLRAGTGRRAKVLIPYPPEWRWMVEGSVSPWFPDFTLYREQRQQGWAPAISTLAADLGSGR